MSDLTSSQHITQNIIPEGMSLKEYLERISYTAYAYGFVPIPLRNKIPVTKDWTNFRNNLEEDTRDIAAGKYPKTIRRVGNLVQFKSSNSIGVVTGEASGVVVLDIDIADDGLNKWKQLVDSNTNGQGLEETFTVRTSSGGIHIYFQYTPDLSNIGNINRILKYPFDYRTNNGMVVFPGSFDKYNRLYRVESGYKPYHEDVNVNMMIISEMPIWIKTILVMDRISKENKKMEINPQTIEFKAHQLGVNLIPRTDL